MSQTLILRIYILGPFVECMIACNADSDCGSFWLVENDCNIVDKSSCQDLMKRKEADDGVTYYVKAQVVMYIRDKFYSH